MAANLRISSLALRPAAQQISQPTIFSALRGHRLIHSAQPAKAVAEPAVADLSRSGLSSGPSAPGASVPVGSPLAVLPLLTVLRTLLVTSVTSNDLLRKSLFAVLKKIVAAHDTARDGGKTRNKSLFTLSVDHNPALQPIIRHGFYDQFCAGSTEAEVQKSLNLVRKIGYDGVILESSLEILEEKPLSPLEIATIVSTPDDTKTLTHIRMWKKEMLESIRMTGPGDFLGIKWSGLGQAAFYRLRTNAKPSPAMWEAITEVCDAALTRGVRILPSAEQDTTNVGIEAWTEALQAKYNNPSFRASRETPLAPHQALVFSTYQLYLRSSPAKIAAHLARAQEKGYVAGIKLVRGAYMTTEPRETIWATKEETDRAYDGVVESLLRREWNSEMFPTPTPVEFPEVNVFIASHNKDSVRKARKIRDEQRARLAVEGISSGPNPGGLSPDPLPELHYAQLYGMADEISCELAAAARQGGPINQISGKATVDIPRTVKCIAWGSPGSCLQYLFRRAAENEEAAGRTVETRMAMWGELGRRLRSVGTSKPAHVE